MDKQVLFFDNISRSRPNENKQIINLKIGSCTIEESKAEYPNLQTLHMINCKANDIDSLFCYGNKLTKIIFVNCEFKNITYEHFKYFTELKRIEIIDTNIPKDGFSVFNHSFLVLYAL